MNKREMQRNVARGVRLLDAKENGWWRNGTTPNGINIDKLDMAHGDCCILGQRHDGMFFSATDYLDLPEQEDQYRHGFNARDERVARDYADPAFWSYLTELWIAVITARRHPRRKASAWAASLRKERAV